MEIYECNNKCLIINYLNFMLHIGKHLKKKNQKQWLLWWIFWENECNIHHALWRLLTNNMESVWHKYSEISCNLLFLSFDTNTVKYLAIYWFFVKNIIVSGIAIRKQHTYRVTLYVIFWTWQHFIEFIKFIDKIRFTCSTIYSCRAL